jgi:hypothetical protein
VTESIVSKAFEAISYSSNRGMCAIAARSGDARKEVAKNSGIVLACRLTTIFFFSGPDDDKCDATRAATE